VNPLIAWIVYFSPSKEELLTDYEAQQTDEPVVAVNTNKKLDGTYIYYHDLSYTCYRILYPYCILFTEDLMLQKIEIVLDTQSFAYNHPL
jgi:hypothetical protein